MVIYSFDAACEMFYSDMGFQLLKAYVKRGSENNFVVLITCYAVRKMLYLKCRICTEIAL